MRWLEKRKHCLTASRSLCSPRPPPDHIRLLPPPPSPDEDLPQPPKICRVGQKKPVRFTDNLTYPEVPVIVLLFACFSISPFSAIILSLCASQANRLTVEMCVVVRSFIPGYPTFIIYVYIFTSIGSLIITVTLAGGLLAKNPCYNSSCMHGQHHFLHYVHCFRLFVDHPLRMF